jgi:Holliday junction resolvase RusA-like endonuclease
VLRYRAYKDKCRVHRVPVTSGCTVIFWLPMPASWSARKRTKMLGLPHRQKPDLDNLIKGLWDARVKRDEQLSSVTAEKRWGASGAIEVWVPAAEVPDAL